MLNRNYLSEFLGTFILVFCGTGAIIINQETRGIITHVGVAMVFGLVVMVLIYSFGKISGCHINPAVTVALSIAKKFDKNLVVPYIFSQFLGAFLASFILKILFPINKNLGATLPQGADYQPFILETLLTFFLVLVILNTTKNTTNEVVPAIAIGATVGLEALFAGPICGASMNPARSLAPAIVSGNLQSIWIYLTAPFIGAILAVFIHNFLYKKNQS